ncbi:YfiR family protein [Methylibium rhizosphaerae]|uniref:YfiR family protein n=1 Tax=Methylibium rhizosphaerae TaxID=2570323 RepID=UPI001126C736|nr:YfiR family protein [Methylibium rhizosphaerae]
MCPARPSIDLLLARRRAARLAALALLLACLLPEAGWSQADSPQMEYQVKAAFVCKFASYVEWPPQAFEKPDSPVTIAVAGSDAVYAELVRTATGQQAAEGRAFVVRRLAPGASLNGIHIVYVARSHASRLAEVLNGTKGQPTLTVTESEQEPAGAVINFVIVNDKVRFDISLPTAESSNLKISARLLAVARRVVQKPG